MVVPFDSITISRAVAEQMYHWVSEYCKAIGDLKLMEYRYRYATPPTQESLLLAKITNQKNSAAFHLTELVLKHIVNPNFD